MAAVSSCVIPAHIQVDGKARRLGFERAEVGGNLFRHVVYKTPMSNRDAPLHVYIEGDGISWRSRYVISNDPTPRDPLMLQMMALDSSDSLYVGRPCYFGYARDTNCHSDYWTYARYSDEVVSSMERVIASQADGYSSLVLIGHSGGAALALLLAERLRNVTAVVTVAGNLDVAAWTSHHRYTPLYQSIDPALQPPLAAHIRQLHLLGGQDEVIPPRLVGAWLSKQVSAEVWRFDQYTHSCCWVDEWPQVLQWIDSAEIENRQRIRMI
ncbi:hypothetical protein AB833_11745 [Chromatiales bacterium (ex Bugula neritina AB1)]|nr:hypothetical protein AB833_11745 [Chromatiales bacterium (ex Bugula neritina AB1)]